MKTPRDATEAPRLVAYLGKYEIGIPVAKDSMSMTRASIRTVPLRALLSICAPSLALDGGDE